MRSDLPELLPLICLGCRRHTEHGHDVFTVELELKLRCEGADVLEGVLRCVSCGRRYPIIDGIPILVGDLGTLLARDLPGLSDPEMAPEVAALLALPGPDDTPMARALEMLSIYLDAHWGDRAVPPLAERLSRGPRVARAIELGCSLGRGLHELARSAELTVGVDLGLGALRRARRLLSGQGLRYAQRVVGRHYRHAEIAPPAPAANVELICADAQDPPLVPGRFDRVCAVNLIDAVHDPGAALAVAQALVGPGGELHLASPYAWQSGIVGEDHRIGGADPAAEIARRLRAGGFSIDLEEEIDWRLRRDDRSAVAYAVHYLRAHRLAT